MTKFLEVIRWVMFLPLGFTASVIVGLIAYYIIDIVGSAWYVWLVSGAASGVAFISVSLYVAPIINNFSKWSTIIIVGLLGAISAIGSMSGGQEPVAAFAGITLLIVAVSYARTPNDLIGMDILDKDEEIFY